MMKFKETDGSTILFKMEDMKKASNVFLKRVMDQMDINNEEEMMFRWRIQIQFEKKS